MPEYLMVNGVKMQMASGENTPDFEARKGLGPWTDIAYGRLSSRQPSLLRELREANALRPWLREKADAVADLFMDLLLKGVNQMEAQELAIEAYLDLEPEMSVDEWAREAAENQEEIDEEA